MKMRDTNLNGSKFLCSEFCMFIIFNGISDRPHCFRYTIHTLAPIPEIPILALATIQILERCRFKVFGSPEAPIFDEDTFGSKWFYTGHKSWELI